jgi:hypothetical protein
VKVEYALPCRGVEQLADGTNIVIGLEANSFAVPVFPHPVAVVLLICLSQPPAQVGPSAMTVAVLNPQMQDAAPPLTATLDSSVQHPNLPAGWSQRSMSPSLVQFLATEPGCYSIEITVDGSSHSVALLVSGPPPEA